MGKIRVCVIGIGYLGKQHARLYAKLKNAQLVGLCDSDPAKRAVAEEYGVPFYEDYRALFGQVDAASIVVPTQDHHRIAKDFLEQGIPLLIEKPITKTVEEADELLKIAKDRNCLVQVGHIERFNSAFLAALPFIKNPMFIECHRLGPFKKRALDVGVVLDLMIHDIDIVLSIVKSPLDRVDGIGIPVLTDHEDIANARLSFQNGAVANLTASRLTEKSMRKVRIFAEGTYVSLDTVGQKGMRYWKENGEIHGSGIHFKRQEPLEQELISFLDAVAMGRSPVVPGEEAREALRFALEIQEKIRCHKRWPNDA
ncbi:MAG: Gfo/Idh/MocA family oxidoreductase [Candidatus Omnitrophota bacterium]